MPQRYCEANSHPYSRASSPTSQRGYGHEDKRALKEGNCSGSPYPSWSTPAYPSYPSNEVKGFVPAYCMPPHGMPPLMPMPYGPGAAGHMVSPQPPMFGIATSRPIKTRADLTDSSSSNCTPRDHYKTPDRHSPQKKHSRKEVRLPVVKIPEALKRQGQPSPAPWLNQRGYPLRMGKPDCKHYTTKGWCAYGTLCKFNHPEDMPVMMPCVPGSQPMMMTTPWMGVPCQWSAPWNQTHAQMAGYPHYMCHPPSAEPCSVESGRTSSASNGRVTDAEGNNQVYN